MGNPVQGKQNSWSDTNTGRTAEANGNALRFDERPNTNSREIEPRSSDEEQSLVESPPPWNNMQAVINWLCHEEQPISDTSGRAIEHGSTDEEQSLPRSLPPRNNVQAVIDWLYHAEQPISDGMYGRAQMNHAWDSMSHDN
ncbi:hypothetical protein AJ80_05221 [Polytolypa hystricis UAMH7299]|uniref:Uncharacterized protein n=1 Tax=Polytolypa hystricis (strain UAMH7299) TaxID=1447883 RepID=A0A2B7Y5U3_POLH7|nr:hypothetical protein AJ80_05221 [Polytolypa hystricis UAMH7299]